MKRYFKIFSLREHEASGNGWGYEDLFGNKPRYFWDEEEANKRADMLNAVTAGQHTCGEYGVEMRNVYSDGTFDDEDDDFARQQLGL